MCGIGVYFIHSASENSREADGTLEIDAGVDLTHLSNFKEWLTRRGPTAQSEIKIEVGDFSLIFYGAVLHIQGNDCVPQPVVDEDGNILLWNGEVFDGLEYGIELSDTMALSNLLQKELKELDSDPLHTIISQLIAIKGPYSFIYFHNASKQIIFGRDPFGRRSLILQKLENRLITMSNVSFPTTKEDSLCTWEELPIGGLYSIPFDGDLDRLTFQAWPSAQPRLCRQYIASNSSLSDSIVLNDSVQQFSSILQNVLKKRINKFIDFNSEVSNSSLSANLERKSRIGVLFSGGIDSLLLAAALHLSLLSSCSSSDENEPIDLLNVAFIDNENSLTSAPDRLSGILAYLELKVKSLNFSIFVFVLKLFPIEIIPGSGLEIRSCRCFTRRKTSL
jgi:asparagine synthetase B (glutamine-hydrolysing)